MSRRILFGAELVKGSRGYQRISAMRELGHEVLPVSTAAPGATYEDPPRLADRIRHRLAVPADRERFNLRLIDEARQFRPDTIWIDRVPILRKRTLSLLKQELPGLQVVWYAEDDMMNRQHRSLWLDSVIPLFDLWVTTKSFNARPSEVPSLGAKKVLFVNNAYDPDVHYPVSISPGDRKNFGSDIAFVGTYEAARAESLCQLAAADIGVRVWGNGWEKLGKHPEALRLEKRPVYNEEYCKVVTSSSINLCFLRKANRDLQTCRSIEIPAIGGFMLHERNPEICGLLVEDQEAVYFESDEELIQKCRNWLNDNAGRQRIADQGQAAVTKGGYTHQDQIRQVFSALEEDGTS